MCLVACRLLSLFLSLEQLTGHLTPGDKANVVAGKGKTADLLFECGLGATRSNTTLDLKTAKYGANSCTDPADFICSIDNFSTAQQDSAEQSPQYSYNRALKSLLLLLLLLLAAAARLEGQLWLWFLSEQLGQPKASKLKSTSKRRQQQPTGREIASV